MTIQAQTPDGAIHEFPDGTPDNVIDGAIQTYLKPQPSMMSKLGGYAAGKIADMAQNERDYQSGKTNLASLGIRQLGVAGNVAGDAVPDVVKSAVGSALSPIAPAAQFGADKIDQADPQTSNALLGLQDAGNTLAQNHPELAGDIKSGIAALNLLPAAQVAKLGAKGVMGLSNMKDVGTGLNGLLGDTSSGVSATTALNIPTLGGATLAQKVGSSASDVVGALKGDGDILNTGQIKDIAGRSFAAADDTGAFLHPDKTNALIDRVSMNSPQTAEGKIFAGDNPVTTTINDFAKLKDKPLTLSGAMEVDQDLGDRILAAKRAGSDKIVSQLQGMQRDFRNGLLSAGDSGDLVGGADAVNAWREGQQAWSAAMKMRDLDNISMAAASSDNPASAIKTAAKNLLKSPLKSWGYRSDEIDALKSTSQSGILTDLLRTAGSRLGPLIMGGAGLATGGPLGAAAAGATDYALAGTARAGASALQNARLNAAKRMVSNRPEIAAMTGAPVETVVSEKPPAAKLLTYQKPESVLAVDTAGNVAPQTSDQQLSGIVARRAAQASGLTPDIIAAQIKRSAPAVSSELSAAMTQNPKLLMQNLAKLSPQDAQNLLGQLFNENPQAITGMRQQTYNQAFETAEKEALAKKAADSVNAPSNVIPLEDLIGAYVNKVGSVSQASGESGNALSQALAKALKKKGK